MKPESCIKEITGEIKLDFAKELREFQGDLKDFGKKQNDFCKSSGKKNVNDNNESIERMDKAEERKWIQVEIIKTVKLEPRET